MAVKTDDVLYTARLARLELSESDAEAYVEGLESILGYFQVLQEVHTENVEPTIHLNPETDALRDDASHVPFDREVALANAPTEDGEHFIVPRVI